MTTAQVLKELEAYDDPALLKADGFDDALLGVLVGACRSPVLCYDYEKCIQILMRDSAMNRDDAIEYFEFNTVSAYVGERTPLYLQNLRKHKFWLS